jgi:hypothetical protein
MRTSFVTATLSLSVHAAVATALLWPARTPPSPADPAPRLAGETFELPAPETTVVPLANASPSPDTVAPAATEIDAPEAPARPRPPARATHRPERPSHAGRPSGGRARPSADDGAPGGTSAKGLYGAVGDRSASDLATAFIRGFSLASSADPLWTSAPLGGAGEATVTITLDASGHVAGSEVSGAPSRALASGVRRTIALIEDRPFVAKGKVTRLHLSATVSTDTSGGFGVGPGGSEDKREGTSWFRLASGRRVDLHVRVR